MLEKCHIEHMGCCGCGIWEYWTLRIWNVEDLEC